MAFSWSEDQKKVIDLRDRDILVSAAAGSGKTTVLVERIIQMILDENHPIDIDELLVVTFTKAAAGEMKEKISKALDDKLSNTLDEELKKRLIRQSALVQHAMITTIDSFCLFVVRNYFEEIGLDPNFRVADENEVALIVKDMVEKVFEENYERKDNDGFLQLIDNYSDSKKDDKVREMVEKIYKTSLSSPWPKKWIQELVRSCSDIESVGEEQCLPIRKLVDLARANIEEAILAAKSGKRIAQRERGPRAYEKTFDEDAALLEGAKDIHGFSEMQSFLSNFKFPRLATIKSTDETVDQSLVAVAQDIRKKYKDSISKIQKTYFSCTWQEICSQQKELEPTVAELARLAEELFDAVAEQKKKKRIVDFSDMEHFALQILVDEETNMPRPVANDFRKHYKEIMVDEYQDSNEVQETILKAISGASEGNYNMFMVGDVKQSIYRFRMAKPDLFVQKYEHFSKEDSKQQRIDLSMNYRSREGVLEFCNVIFEGLMEKELGGIVYDESARLNYGASFEESSEACAEVMVIDAASLKKEKEELNDIKATEMEALMVAHRILELKESGKYHFSDFVILLRSLQSSGPVFQEILEAHGIPAHVDSKTGYFSAQEVELVLNVLRLIDNPNQDIAMASVLKSFFVGYTDEDLAEIAIKKREDKTSSFAQAALCHLKENEHPFYELLEELRKRKDLAIHELLLSLFERTGYDSYVLALPGGKTRYANLRMLVQKAIDFEQTNYRGVFHFLRYIHQMKKYNQDFGEADVEGESGDIVHIMTIHKSKGLEFPVVFLSNTSKHFNEMDQRGDFILHSDLGIGMRKITGSPRAKSDTAIRDAIVNFEHLEELGEELRVLYVALTRAKEKLIITSSKMPETIEAGGVFGFAKKIKAKSYIEWIIPALYAAGYSDYVKEVDLDYIFFEEAKVQLKNVVDYGTMLAQIDAANEEKVQEIIRYFSFEYPYQKDIDRKSKYSVSEIKHASMVLNYEHTEEGSEVPEFAKEEKDVYIPKFAIEDAETKTSDNKISDAKTSAVPAGALFGTAVHRVMEVLDFAAFSQVDKDDASIHQFAKNELDRMLSTGELDETLAKRLRGNELETFLHSDIALDMANAAARGELYREKPFVMLWEEGSLVQGIIDVFWKDEDGIVLLDYKTDRVDSADELILRYKEQLLLYKDALERMYGKVKATLIYSYRLKEVISI